MRLRYSIAGLMGLVMVIAVGFAALRYPGEIWASLLLTFAVAVLCTATVASLCRVGRQQAWWAGVAVFGWAYFLLAFGPGFSTEVGPHLATTRLLDALFPRLHDISGEVVKFHFLGPSDQARVAEAVARDRPEYPRYLRAGHSLGCLLAGFFGGLVALYLDANRRHDPEGGAP